MADTASLVVRVKTDGVSQTDKQLGALTKTASAVSMALGGVAIAATATAIAFAGRSIAANRAYTKSLSDLSAITGATGKQLEYLSAQSLAIGASTSLSASQASEAFKLIASAKPDLLESATALNEVTRAAVTLAEAAGSDLPTAADTLGSALNQFGADADQASRYINVLAAGAKFGSSEINDTAIALKNAGVAAKAVGVDFEEANAAIQALAAVGIKGGEAGTGLRNILLKLESDTNTKIKPSVNGFVGALQNLADMQEDSTQLTKRFGLENVTTAQALLGNVGAVKELTDKLTGTNTAMEQASTKINNLDGDIKILESSTEALALAIGSKLNPVTRDSVQLFAASAQQWALYIDSLGNAPETVDGVRAKLVEVNAELAETQARQKRFGSNNFWDAIFGGAGDKVQQVKALQDESKRLTDRLAELQGVGLDGAPAKTKVEKPISSAPETSAEGQAQLEALSKRAELYRVVGVERERLAAVQSLGAGATEKEKAAAAALAEEIYNLTTAQAAQDAAERSFASNRQSAEAYLEQLRQANLTEMQLIDTQEQEKKTKLQEFRDQNLISEQQYQDALTEIQTTAVISRAEIQNDILDEQSRIADETRKQQIADAAAAEAAMLSSSAAAAASLGDITSALQSAGKEQSAAYKVLFAAQKAAAIPSMITATEEGATKALSLGPIAGPIAAGAIKALGYASIGVVAGQAITGAREQGGYMTGGSAYQMAERGKAEVIVPAGNSRAKTISQMNDMMGGNSGSTSVVIVNQTTGRIDSAESDRDDEGRIRIIIREEVSSGLLNQDSQIAKARRSTRGQAGY